MKIHTAHFGERDIEASDIISFPKGLPGLPNKHQFALLPEDLDPPVFLFLQSTEDADLAFTVSMAQKFGITYDDTLLTDTEMQTLGLKAFSDAIVLLLISENHDHPHRRQFDPKFIPHISNPIIVNPLTRKGLYKELRGVHCSATISALAETDDDAEVAKENYMRFLAMMQAGIKAP